MGASMKSILLVLVLGLSSTALGQVTDSEIVVSKDWQAMTVTSDEAWLQPSCVASTLGDDGVSTIEVIAFFNPNTGAYGEPLVHVIAPFDVIFFEVSATTSSSSGRSYVLLPVNLPQSQINGVSYAGARALFDDRQELVKMS